MAIRDNTNITLPVGYALESLPKPMTIVAVKMLVFCLSEFRIQKNKIQITVTLKIKVPLVSADFYEAIKNIKEMHDKLNELSVLKKN